VHLVAVGVRQAEARWEIGSTDFADVSTTAASVSWRILRHATWSARWPRRRTSHAVCMPASRSSQSPTSSARPRSDAKSASSVASRAAAAKISVCTASAAAAPSSRKPRRSRRLRERRLKCILRRRSAANRADVEPNAVVEGRGENLSRPNFDTSLTFVLASLVRHYWFARDKSSSFSNGARLPRLSYSYTAKVGVQYIYLHTDCMWFAQLTLKQESRATVVETARFRC